MQKYVYWFRELVNSSNPNLNALNYGKLYVAGFPVPSGFVVDSAAKSEIQKAVGIDDVSKISPSSIPETIRKDIINHYFKLDVRYDYDSLTDETKAMVGFGRESNLVLVKSGNRAYPNVRGTGELLEAVLKCLSVDAGPVVIQKMVSPEKSGIVFTSKSGSISLKATYGFATPISRDEVEPDVYVVSKRGEVINKSLGAKRFSLVTNKHNRTIEKLEVPREKRETYVLHQREIDVISRLANKLEEHAGRPQKAIWAVDGRRVYLLDTEDYSDVGSDSYSATPSYGFNQSFDKPSYEQQSREASISEPLKRAEVSRFGDLASPVGNQSSQRNQSSQSWNEQASSFGQRETASPHHDSLRESKSPEPVFKDIDSSSFEGGSGGFGDRDSKPEEQEKVSSDMFGDFSGAMDLFESSDFRSDSRQQERTQEPSWQESKPEPSFGQSDASGFGSPSAQSFEQKPAWRSQPSMQPNTQSSTQPSTSSGFSFQDESIGTDHIAPKKGVIISSTSEAQSLASQNPDSVLIKIDDINQGGYATSENMARTLYDSTAPFSNKEVIVRLGDARANVGFTGARGVRRFGTQELNTELTAISNVANKIRERQAYDSGIAMQRPNLKLALPFVISANEVRNAKSVLAQHNLQINVGVVIETPAAVSTIDELAEQANFVLIDTDNLAELMLAVDKSDSKVSHLYDIKHNAVLNAVKGVIKICKGKNVPVYVCGTATKHSDFKQMLKENGASMIFSDANSFNKSGNDSFNKPANDLFGSSALTW